MKKKVVAGFMAATMMVSVMTTGVFAKDLDPTDETQRSGDTTVTATVEENPNKADYIIRIPETVDFGTIKQPETEGDAYSYKDITVECVKADNLEAGTGIAVLVKDASIQNGTWYDNGFLFNVFTKAGQSATDQLRLNRNQLYNKDLSTWGERTLVHLISIQGLEMYLHNKKEWSDARKGLFRIIFMSIFLVCIFTLSVPRKSLAQETTDSATYAGSTSVKAYVTGNSENEQENHPEEEEHLQDESTANAKTGDESNARIWIVISIFSMLAFGCGVKYKKGNK